MEIIGGIYVIGTDQIDAVVYGGNSVVVGNLALDAMQDRALYLKTDLRSLDDKKLLGIISMSQPISFGTIDTDDGETSFIVSRSSARASPSEKLREELNARLGMEPAKIAELLSREFKLNQSVWLALGAAVDSIIEQIDASLTCRGKPVLKTIMIAPSLGELVPFTKSGKLEVATDARPNDPKTAKALMTMLIELAVKQKCISTTFTATDWKTPEIPVYPTLDIQLTPDASEHNSTVADYVAAIIKRENELTPYLVAIERYNVEIARGIQEYTKHVALYLAN
jgi:hypothetical protein